MKKILSFMMVFVLMFMIVACNEEATSLMTTQPTTTETTTQTPTTTEGDPIVIDVDVSSLTLIEDQSHQLVVTSNDPIGLIYSVDVPGIITLSDTGYVTAVSEGDALITIRSRTDDTVAALVQVEVRKEIYLMSNQMEINLVEGDTHQLVISSNDDFDFSVTNTDILSVDSDGLLIAKSEGTTSVVVTSTYDPNVSISISVTIDKLITLDVGNFDYRLVVGDQMALDVESNDELIFLSGDTNIVTVDEDGNLIGVGFGQTTVTIRSAYNTDVETQVNVKVFKYTEEISIVGNELMIKGMELALDIEVTPVGSLDDVYWESSDESILSVDATGLVTALASGSATITATSKLDDSIVDVFSIAVANILVVDESKTSGDTYMYESLELDYGVQLFSTINDALQAAEANTKIYIEAGTYQESIVINHQGLDLFGLNEYAIIDGSISIQANMVTISNLTFESTANITNIDGIENFIFQDNIIRNINHTENYFMHLTEAENTLIINNDFNGISGHAIELYGVHGDLTDISHNTIHDADTAILITASDDLALTDEVKVFWNTISQVELAFDVDFSNDSNELAIFKVARFNQVSDYTAAVHANEDSLFDFTLNYWDAQTLDFDLFTNVDPYYLKGYYGLGAVMPTESSYNPNLPIIIEVTNPIDEIMIGETHTFEYQILPYELADAPVKFITGDPDIIAINQSGTITPLISGEVYIQVRSGQVSSIRTQTNFNVITTPGIEILTSHEYNDIVVGDTFTLQTELFPYTIEGQTASIASSAPSVATVDASGLVTTHAEGMVTFTASLVSDPSVSVDYTIYVHGSLDPEHNLLDYLTTKQINYSTIHKWTAYGFQYNYYDTRAESVSRYYFGDIPINDSKMVPVTTGIRPGEPMSPLPDGITQYNEYNVHWIVVHDTASTAIGSNALAHANYLYNNALLENELWVSWHFTIDDHDIYQHLPETERGYHAGDGSTLPGQSSTYFGGGNRNGIGIEMSVNEDGDMYRTWQRTAKLVTYLLDKYNLPIEQQAYHNDFSGKDCPNTLRNAGLVPLFEEFLDTEYYIKTTYPDAVITMTSNNPEYLDDEGRIIQIPQRAMTVSYTITVTDNGVTESRTFYTYLPGTVR